MDANDFDHWLHASDGEREAILDRWRHSPDAGRAVVTAVAGLFQRECIYEVEAAEVTREGTEWLIDAYLNADDYALLHKRKSVKFLGIPVRFHESKAGAAVH